MQLLPVNNAKTKKMFHQVPLLIYKNDSNWAQLPKEIVEAVFDHKKNSALQYSNCQRFVLLNGEEKPVGRIAAFYKTNQVKPADDQFAVIAGGCGFFECINDQLCADELFNAARNWLQQNGVEAMDGPINLGENYNHWGLLVEGFMPQGYGMPYNKPYYLELFKRYGFKLYFKQFSYHLSLVGQQFPDRFWKIANWVSAKPNYQFKHFKWRDEEKFVNDFVEIYNQAWDKYENFIPMQNKTVYDFIKQSKAILDEECVWFAYNQDKPIAFLVMVPDINQIFQKLKGNLNWFNILRFFWLKKQRTVTRLRILIMGVVPQFQNSGIESAIFLQLKSVMAKRPWINELELSWAGDFNPRIITLYQSVGAKHAKTHYTLRFMFNPQTPFKRAATISVGKPLVTSDATNDF